MKPSPAAAASFYAALADGLDELDRTIAAGQGAFCVASLRSAATLLRAAHSKFVACIAGGSASSLPAAWIGEYVDETSRISDACGLLRAGVASLESYAARAACAVAALDAGSGARQVSRTIAVCKREAMAIQEENRVLLESWGPALSLHASRGAAADAATLHGSSSGLIGATRTLGSLLLAILLSGIVHWLPIQSSDCCGLSDDRNPFEAAMSKVRRRVMAAQGSGTMMYEFQQAAMSVEKAESGEETAEGVKMWVGLLKAGCEDLAVQIDDLFDDILESRKRLLDANQ